jgi:hypothetical protein
VKTVSAGLDTHLAGVLTTLAYGVKATREDGEIFAYSTHDRTLTVSGTSYKPGFTRTAIESSGDLSVDNLDIEGAFESDEVTEDDIRAGLWDHCDIRLVMFNWADTSQGVLKERRGWLGEITGGRLKFRAELRGLLQKLQQEIGRLVGPCPWRVGGTECGVRLDPPAWEAATPYTVRQSYDAKTGSVVKPTTQNGRHFKCTTAGTSDGSEPSWNTTVGGTTNDNDVVWTTILALTHGITITGVTDDRVFADSSLDALDFGDNHWADGTLEWLTGLNEGRTVQVKRSLDTGGALELRHPMFKTVAVNDTATLTAGCMHRRDEDCVAKFDNIYNNGGFYDVPGLDQIQSGGL